MEVLSCTLVTEWVWEAHAPFGTSSPRQSISPFTQYADTIGFTKGAHSFQAGFEFDFAASHQANHGSGSVGTTRPLSTLGVGNTPVPNLTTTNFKGLNSSDVTTAQNLLANLAGSIATIQEEFFVNSPTQKQWLDYRDSILFFRDLHENDWDLFFKDNWKVSKNFTLNVGMRYDKYGTPYDTTGLGGRPKGGQSGLFGCSGTSFSVMWNPNAGCDLSRLTQAEFAGKDWQTPGNLFTETTGTILLLRSVSVGRFPGSNTTPFFAADMASITPAQPIS